MPTKLSTATFEIAVHPGPQTPVPEREAQSRFNIVVLGDFTGRASRGLTESLSTRRLLHVEVDNCERVFAQLGAKLQLTGSGIGDGGIELAFASLEDFHPDELLPRVSSLAQLAEARRLVLNPATAEQGRAALQKCLGAALTASPGTQTAAVPAAAAESDNDTMARLLGGRPPATPTVASPSSPLEQFIRQVVAPQVSAAPGAWQSGAIAAAEMELTSRLNALLHHPEFHALEAVWRGADSLVRRVESSEEIGLFLADVSFAELQADFAGPAAVESSALFRLLRDRKPRLLVGNYTFGQTADDLRLLGKFAELAARLSATFVASAAPGLVGCDSFALHPDPDDWTGKLAPDVAETWAALRRSPYALRVALTAPRFLVRQPYGKAGSPIELFPFEEIPGAPLHASFLWGHSAVLCACAVIDALQSGDPELSEFTGGEIGDLPVHKSSEAGEVVVKPYAEAWLTDRAVDRMLKHGILPVVPLKNQNTIRLNHICSIAEGPVALRLTN